MLRAFASAALLAAVTVNAAAAQNVSRPSEDWNSSWGFPSSGERQTRLLQSDLIEKKEQGYYESLGRQTIILNTHNDYRQGYMEVNAGEGTTVEATNHNGDDIGQNTNVIGAINQSETNIDISGDGSLANVVNEAGSDGCQDGSISIDAPGAATTGMACN